MTITAAKSLAIALQAAQVPQTQCLWGNLNPVPFTPAVLERVFGDGRALFKFITVNNRPAYWIVQGCSSWSTIDSQWPDEVPAFSDFSDRIIEAIAGQFGSMHGYEQDEAGRWVDTETGEAAPATLGQFPCINDDIGCFWERLDWPQVDGIETVGHPFADFSILRD